MKSRSMFHLVSLLVMLFSLVSNAIPLYSVQAAVSLPAETLSLLQFTSNGHILGFTSSGIYAATGSHALHIDFVNANNVRPQSASPVSKDGRAAALTSVSYTNLWDGISLTYLTGGIYTTVYTLAPGADVSDIQLHYNVPLTLNKDGSLSIAFESGTLTESAPIAWQTINDQRVAVEVGFKVHGRYLSFALGAYDPDHPLMIDPTLIWNTFLGGIVDNSAYAIAIDTTGNLYLAGYSHAAWGCSPTPCTMRASIGADAFAAKLSSSGDLIWNTFLGGNGSDTGYSIAIDGSGNVYVGGFSSETWGSPVIAYGGGNYDAFAAKLDSSGNLTWNTFLGGGDEDRGGYLTVDGDGNVYVTGYSATTWGSPVLAFAGGNQDTFAAKLNSSGNLIWHTFLGGNGNDFGYGVVVDGSGNVYVTGNSSTAWTCTPTECTIRAFSGGTNDAFVAKLNSSGSLQWNTFIGGNGNDSSQAIDIDGNGNLYVVGYSEADWGNPISPFTAFNGLGQNAFVAKLASSGSLTWNTFLGEYGTDWGRAIDVDGNGNIYVGGISNATWGNPLREFSGSSNADAFAAKLDTSGNKVWNTFLGSSGSDAGYSIVVGNGNVYVAGYSSATWGSPIQAYSPPGNDAFVGVAFPVNYSISFNANGGSGLMSNQVANSPTAIAANAFTRSGYSFSGWNTAADGSGTSYANGATYDFSADITLYAQWTAVNYTVTFNANGGSGSMSNQSASSPTTLTANTFTRSGYSFSGWNTAANGSGTAYADGATYDFSADITLYAQWIAINHTVTFNANGGAGSMAPQVTNLPATLTTNAFTRTGYSFSGWNTAANGSGTTYTNGATYDFSADVTLYAQWTAWTATFSDVPLDYWAWKYIESLYDSGITGGCSTNPLSYCPTQAVTRAQMAVFLLKGIHGSSYAPPAVNGNTGFNDVASDYWAAAWIKQLAAEGITGGCGVGIYCPDNTVTRDQMAVFLLKAKYGSSYAPPAVNGDTGFTDVPSDYWAAAWIKQLAAEAITGGCGSGVYCPDNPVTRDQMAVFLQKTFNLPLP